MYQNGNDEKLMNVCSRNLCEISISATNDLDIIKCVGAVINVAGCFVFAKVNGSWACGNVPSLDAC